MTRHVVVNYRRGMAHTPDKVVAHVGQTLAIQNIVSPSVTPKGQAHEVASMVNALVAAVGIPNIEWPTFKIIVDEITPEIVEASRGAFTPRHVGMYRVSIEATVNVAVTLDVATTLAGVTNDQD